MILLVTPEVEFSKQMANWLEAKGYPVKLAFQGDKVLARVRQGNPELIVVNLYLRNPSGLEVLRQLRAEGYAGKIIVLASKSTSTEIPQSLFFGVHHVLGLPLSLNLLISSVHLAIGPSAKHEGQVTR